MPSARSLCALARVAELGRIAGCVFVRLPSPSVFVTSAKLGGFFSSVLLRSGGGAIWLLGASAYLWSASRIARANRVLCGLAGGADRPARARAALSEELRTDIWATIPSSLRLEEYCDVRGVARAWIAICDNADGESGGGANGRRSLRSAERCVQLSLARATREFAATLDPELRALAGGRELDPRIYSWLAVDPTPERRRVQFASQFPCLLPFVAGACAIDAGNLARLVDEGAPFVRGAARIFGVAPGTVRAVGGVQIDVVGAEWAEEPGGLFRVLDALPAGRRPRKWSEWARLRRVRDAVSERVDPVPAESPLARAFIREVYCGGAGARLRDRKALRRLAAAVAPVAQLRGALVSWAACFGAEGERVSRAAQRGAARAVDEFLGRMSTHRLIVLAARYRSALVSEVGERLADEIGFMHGERGWPLMAGDYLSGDRSRLVIALTTRSELRRFGRLLDNCLAGRMLDEYLLRLNRSYIVALVDARSLRAVSMAELSPSGSGRASGLEVVQHQARGNRGSPSPECRRALAEVLELVAQPAWQAHLERGARLAQARASAAATVQLAGIAPVRAALYEALGTKGALALRAQVLLARSRLPELALPRGDREKVLDGQLALAWE